MFKLIKYLIIFFVFFSVGAIAKQSTINSNVSSFREPKYFGDDDVPPSVYDVYSKQIKEVEDYLNSFQTFTASFKQSNVSGAIRYGKIFISKPGKVRCEYLSPSPVLLLMHGKKIVFYDKDLDQISYTSSDIKSITLLAIEKLKFSDVNLVEVEQEDHFIEFTVKENIDNSNQILLITLKFSYPDIALKQITITTVEGDIDLIIDDVSYNKTLGKELFSFNSEIIKKGI